MKKSAKITLRQKSSAELQKSLTDLQKQLVEHRVKQSTGNLKDTSVFQKIRTQIAFIKTIITANSLQQ